MDILIVEADAESAGQWAVALRAAGHRVFVSGDADDAFERLVGEMPEKEKGPDLIVVGTDTGDLAPADFIGRVRRHGVARPGTQLIVPIILVGADEAEDADLVLRDAPEDLPMRLTRAVLLVAH